MARTRKVIPLPELLSDIIPLPDEGKKMNEYKRQLVLQNKSGGKIIGMQAFLVREWLVRENGADYLQRLSNIKPVELYQGQSQDSGTVSPGTDSTERGGQYTDRAFEKR